MYQLPEYREGQEYCYVKFVNHKYIIIVYSELSESQFKRLLLENNIFATRELAQIEADRRNAWNKLKNLAREREKEFPIDSTGFAYTAIFTLKGLMVQKVIVGNVDFIYFAGFNNFADHLGVFENWLRSVMSESEIKALCMPPRYV